MPRTVVAAFAAAIVVATGIAAAFAGPIGSSVDPSALPVGKQTAAGLYVTSRDAQAALDADPGIVFIDVRSQAEFAMIGHPATVDGNVPVKFLTDRFNPESGAYAMDTNPGFVADVDALMARLGEGKDAPVLVICRSGDRSAVAANMLTSAGYARVYSVVDGFEGAVDKASGHRTVDGWRNADLPWTYKLPAGTVYIPAQ